jgi:hypothetical protein
METADEHGVEKKRYICIDYPVVGGMYDFCLRVIEGLLQNEYIIKIVQTNQPGICLLYIKVIWAWIFDTIVLFCL